jgi:ribosomal peptide maturation radical SAM protein 1
MGRELVRVIDCIDYAVIGEGDQAFPELLQALTQGKDPASVPGVISRQNAATMCPPTRAPLASLEGLPVPDYSEYFDRLQSFNMTGVPRSGKLRIPFESSRGCWWGQKHHCTFCGLNGATMRFRRKPIKDLLDELRLLAARHGIFAFEAVDNILDPKMLEELFEFLSTNNIDYDFFYEVKSNLSRRQIRQLSKGGLRRMQPGIESLSTPILKLMKKGVSSIQNVNLLRWACYYKIHTSWNLLWGFPGEQVEHYEEQLRLLRHLTHLSPPQSAGRVWMERFSPLFADRDLFPVTSLRAESSYSYIYPKCCDLDRIAYFFDYKLADTLPDSVFADTVSHVASWQAAWRTIDRPKLQFWYSPGITRIEDRRNFEAPRSFQLVEPDASLYAACSDQPRTVAQLRSMNCLSLSEEEIESILNESAANGLMMRDGQQFLSLALPATVGR